MGEIKRDRKEYRKGYYIENRDRVLKYQRENWTKHLESCRKWNENNRERVLENSRNRNKDNPEYFIKWRKNNPKKIKKYKKKYYGTEKAKATRQRRDIKRRARERVIINTLTLKEWLDILEAYNYRCVYCGVEFNCELLPERDHIIPINKGGNNTKDNIVPACRSCNAKKSDMTLQEFKDWISKVYNKFEGERLCN